MSYIKDQFERGPTGEGPTSGYISTDFTDPLTNYLIAQAKENAALARYWDAFHAFGNPGDLKATKIDESFDAYFETMSSYLAPWCRGELPGSGGRQPAFLSRDESAKLVAAKSGLRQPVTGYHAAWRPFSGKVTRLKKGDSGPVDEIARKKFLSILARPGLAKFLGFIIDIEVRASDLLEVLKALGISNAPNSYFYLMADFDADDPDKKGAIDNPQARVWTAAMVERTDAGSAKPRFFGPGTKQSFTAAKRVGFGAPGISALAAEPYDRGVLDLAAPGNDGDPRYAIIDFDIDAALQALENASLDRATASLKGAMDDSIATALPNLQTRGLALIDRDRKSELAKENQGTNSIMTSLALASPPAQILYAEDLVVGFRIDVGMCTADDLKLPDEKRWRSLHNRTVEYDADDIGKAYLSWLGADRTREDGFAKPVTREAEAKGDGGPNQKQFIAQETLAVWTGTSLAVRTERGPQKDDKDDAFVEEIDSYCELGINITSSLPTEIPRRLPPLRLCRGYWMGARLVYANGGSLSLETAVKEHYLAATTTAVGADKNAPRQGFVFMRGERTPAPPILLPPDDVLITKPASTHGEGVSTAVVRGNKQTRRYIVPRNVNFEMAEAHGEFDKQSARSAFTTYARSQKDGSFPSAVKQDPPVVEQDSKTKKRSNPGNVLKPGYSGNAAPYFPDPRARECLIRPLQHDLNEDGDERSISANFYRHKKMTIDNARPILVEISSFEPKSSDPQYTIKVVDHHDMPHVQVQLAKAQDLDLVLWTEPEDDEQLVNMRGLAAGWSYVRRALSRNRVDLTSLQREDMPKQVKALGELSSFMPMAAGQLPPAKPGSTKIRDLLRLTHCAPLRAISDHKRLRVVRPVMAPLAAPYSEPVTFKSVRIVIKPPDQPDSPGEPTLKPSGWAEYLANHGGTLPLDFPSEEDGNTAFFVGTVKVHRPSTSKVRFQATWNDYDDNYGNVRAVGTGDDKRFEYHPVPDRGEFGFEFPRGCEPKNADDLTDLDLLLDETGKLRGLKIDFKNTKARKVKFGVHGISRFTEFYKAPKQPEHAVEFERHDVKHDFFYWVESTRRPEKPEVDRILPVFSGSLSECRHGHRRYITYQRNVSLRIFLKRGWFSTGEGELLGVVCWPSNIFNGGTVQKDMAKCTLLDRAAPKVINPKEEFLTRWGADPLRVSGDLDELVPSSAFDSAAKRKGPLKLPLQPLKLPLQPPDKDSPGGTPTFEIDKGCPNDPPTSSELAPSNSVDVAIAGYKPILEPHQGELWYCDLPIDPQASYFPFIRVGLARYQEHSKAGLELSYPVGEWAQIPPRRTVRVELLNNHDVLVVVQGHGYDQANWYGVPADRAETRNHPAFRMRICRSSKSDGVPGEEGGTWLPLIVEGRALECRVTAGPIGPAGPLLVCKRFHLPHSWQSRSYAVIVEEFEPMVADGSIYTEHVVVDRGPMFACTIPISIHHPPPCAADVEDFGARLQLLDALQDG